MFVPLFDTPVTPTTPTRVRRERTSRMSSGRWGVPEQVKVIAVCDCCEDRYEARRSLLKAFKKAQREVDDI
jgi:hypothetical protein